MLLLRGLLGLAGGHLVACAALHGSGVQPARLVGWSTSPEAVAAVASVALLGMAASSHSRRATGSVSLLGQLLVQGALLAAVEVAESAVGVAPLVSGASGLNDPVVWVGLVAQVVAALWVHRGAQTLRTALRSRRPLAVVRPQTRRLSGPGRRDIPHRLPLEAGPLVRRGPPVGVPVTARS